MPIEHSRSGATTLTGDSIDFFRLAAMRSAVGLELKGIYMRRRRVWTQARREYGIKGDIHAVYAWLSAKVDELRAQQEHVDEAGRRTVGGEPVQ